MIGAEKVMTMTSTYDHRVIQGAESGRFLALIEELLQGEHGFYEDVFAALGVELGAAPRRHRLPPRPPRPAEEPGPAAPAERGAAAGGAGGQRRCSTRFRTPRPSRGSPGPAGLRARGRSRRSTPSRSG